ncbi:MAG: shikimate kinase [Opitutales bacterium]|nr:shikimate kinase [Opitutales bacterium]
MSSLPPPSSRVPSENIILIGMPGSGKSTVGVLLAKELGFAFVDTDILIQQREGCLLQELVDRVGSAQLRAIESDVCRALSCSRTVVATGGSAVYCADAMRHLSGLGPVIWLDAPFPVINERIERNPLRGLAKNPDQTLEDLYDERQPLYRRFGEIRIPYAEETPEATVRSIIGVLPREFRRSPSGDSSGGESSHSPRD